MTQSLTLYRLQGFQWSHLLESPFVSAHCCAAPTCSSTKPVDPRYRRALWIALVLNATMFVTELGAAWASGSVSLLADSIDFFGDAGNYALSLTVLGMSLATRSRAAIFKAACMGAFGIFVLGKTVWNLQAPSLPSPRPWAPSASWRSRSTVASR
jgi:Co/Zn/Cd efflux system component